MKLLLLLLLSMLTLPAFAEYSYRCEASRNNKTNTGVADAEQMILSFDNREMEVYLPAYDKVMMGRKDGEYQPKTFKDYERYRYFENWRIAHGYKVQILINKYLKNGSDWGIARFIIAGRKYVSNELKCTRVK